MRAFLEPVNVTHRQYEALRAYFIDRQPSKQVAARFGYTPGSFRVLCHQFRADPHREFFLPERRRLRQPPAPRGKSTRLREQVVAARKQNLSVYDIAAVLAEQGQPLSPPAICRRRSANLLAELDKTPASAWRRIELSGLSRAYRTPKVLDRQITLRDYTGPIRQLAITDLGHEQPTLLITNQLRRGTTGLIDAYAKRMLIENSISDGVDFFHMDALSSTVAMKMGLPA